MASPAPSTRRLTLLVAPAYLALGAAGLTLAIRPGYASPVFPAAGLALACALRFGPPALPGVWLGSLLLNVGHAAVGGRLSAATTLVAVVIATGATLQAGAGRWLVLRFGRGAWPGMEREQDAFAFLLLGGVVAGVVSASVSVGGLLATGVIEGAQIPFTWWSWYVGDVFGILVFAPLALTFLLDADPLWRERRRRIVAPTLLTLAIAGLAFFGSSRWEQRVEEEQLENDGEALARLLSRRLIAHREVLASLRSFVLATPDFGFDAFARFTRVTLEGNPDVSALSFNDVVPDGDRTAHERRMSSLSPLGPFEIVERDPTGHLVRAGPRPEHVAVRYIVPLDPNRAAVGYDIASEPLRRDAIERARASGDMAVTAPIRLVQEHERPGILEILPVPAEPGGAGGRPGRLLGYAVAVVRMDEFIRLATAGNVPAGLAFRVVDPGAPPGRQLLYRSDAPASEAGPEPHVAARWTTVLPAGQRTWVLAVSITESHLQQHRHWIAWAVGVASLAFATLLQVLMLGMTGRAAIIERKNEELRASERQVRDLLENLHAGVVVHAPDSRVVVANGAACALLGVAADQVPGRTAADPRWRFVRRDGTPMPPDEYPVNRVLATGAPVVNLVAGIDRADLRDRVWVLVNAYPVRGAGGGVAEVVVTLIDVTERQVLEERLAVASHLAAIGTLVAGVAHEINNPLTGQIAGQSVAQEEASAVRDTLRSGTPVDREGLARRLDGALEALSDAQEGGARIARIVRDLTLFARPDPKRTRVRLADVVDEAMRWLPAAVARSATVRVEKADVPDVSASAAQIGQVIVNLVTNAAKSIPPGRQGVVTVRLSPGGPGMARIEVSDDGVGIEPEVLRRIFDPFFTTRKVGEGTGLGLPICHSIVAAHGGTLTVTSRPGEGSTFRVELPVASDPG